MDWVAAIIALAIVMVWICAYWIPHCDKIGIKKARLRELREKEFSL